jgi:primosomal replication protein N
VKTNSVTLCGTVHEEPSYGYTGRGHKYCRFSILWTQEMTEGTKDHDIPAVAAGPCADRAVAELKPGMEIEARGRLSATNGQLKFVILSFTIAGDRAPNPPTLNS